MKNLVVSCDGTWNTADQEHDGRPTPTNVTLLHNTALTSAKQLRYYHPGVGTEGNAVEKALGGSLGFGLSKNIMSAYRWLAENYQPGDRIFLFGFSRGAFTVRSLAGMIGKCGLMSLIGLQEAEIWERIERLYKKKYRSEEHSDIGDGWAFHQEAEDSPGVSIHFIGVWDTVGALGIPDDMGLLNLLDGEFRLAFHDAELGDRVTHARHAIALDERRASFAPTLWTNRHGDPNVKQVWFPGVHSDVGGGYPNRGLSDGALSWMVKEAVECGLEISDEMVAADVKPNYRDVLHDSFRGGFKLLRSYPRSVPDFSDPASPLHQSARNRQKLPPITQAPYREEGILGVPIDLFAREPWNATGIYLEGGTTYTFSATGEWKDGMTITCGPGGTNDGKFQIGELAYSVGSLIGLTERAYRKLTGNDEADFKLTRRREDMPWFSLVGVIANGGNPTNDGTPNPHEFFLIGDGRNYAPTRSGYLYCFANDAWGCYENNRGSVRLVVQDIEI